MTAAVRRIRWDPAFRIIPTRHPTIYLFDRVAEPDDFDVLYALEAMTNDRIRQETGQIDLVPHADRVFGPGSGPIMAAFTHLNPLGSRFSDGGFGVFYAAGDRATSIAETRHHQGRFLAATHEAAITLTMRLYTVHIDARLHDLRDRDHTDPAVLDPDSYVASQALGHRLRHEGSAGIVYPSVRQPGGQCVGLFRPRGARDCLQAANLLYVWDGLHFTGIFEEISA